MNSVDAHLRVVVREAWASAQMHLASVADEAGLRTSLRSVAAHDAVTLIAHALGKVLARQRMSWVQARSTLARYAVARQLLQ